MPVKASLGELAIPPRLRPLVAAWISLGLHAALITLVHVEPPAATDVDMPVIEARLVSTHAVPPAVIMPPVAPEMATPQTTPVLQLVPTKAAEALPVAKPVAALPIPAEPPAAASQPVASSFAASPSEPASAPPAAPASAPGVTITSAVDLTYYSVRDLDVQPRALRKVEPDYPADADRQRLSGKVRLQLKLEADGRVSDIAVVSATPPGTFDDSAVKAFRNVRFSSAQRNGRPVRALLVIDVVFDWEGRR